MPFCTDSEASQIKLNYICRTWAPPVLTPSRRRASGRQCNANCRCAGSFDRLSDHVAPHCWQAFAKLNCNKYNKELGVALKVRVAPTFHLYKNSVKVAEMTGAKIDMLRQLVATHK